MAVAMKRCPACRGMHEAGQCKVDGDVAGLLAAPAPAAVTAPPSPPAAKRAARGAQAKAVEKSAAAVRQQAYRARKGVAAKQANTERMRAARAAKKAAKPAAKPAATNDKEI